jgi:tetratricopeptide (TPR) repeat protein
MQRLGETKHLRKEVERALGSSFDPADVLPRLARLARIADPKSEDASFAHRTLAEVLVDRDPWGAALCAKRALAIRPEDDRAWAVLALCHMFLGHYRCAAKAYKAAITASPDNPWYAHNLGHLLDVALGRPLDALPWLATAYRGTRGHTEIVASYAHALARAGKLLEARRILELALSRAHSRELTALMAWLDEGAPRAPRPNSASSRGRSQARLTTVLKRGLAHLPLCPEQRERAMALARDLPPQNRNEAARRQARSSEDMDVELAGIAAAVAYAIVFIDRVPLSQAEVAAPFRVGVAQLRGRFAELRATLDLIRGDARYASTRR